MFPDWAAGLSVRKITPIGGTVRNSRPIGHRFVAGGSQVCRRWIAGLSQVGRRWIAGGSQVDSRSAGLLPNGHTRRYAVTGRRASAQAWRKRIGQKPLRWRVGNYTRSDASQNLGRIPLMELRKNIPLSTISRNSNRKKAINSP